MRAYVEMTEHAKMLAQNKLELSNHHVMYVTLDAQVNQFWTYNVAHVGSQFQYHELCKRRQLIYHSYSELKMRLDQLEQEYQRNIRSGRWPMTSGPLCAPPPPGALSFIPRPVSKASSNTTAPATQQPPPTTGAPYASDARQENTTPKEKRERRKEGSKQKNEKEEHGEEKKKPHSRAPSVVSNCTPRRRDSSESTLKLNDKSNRENLLTPSGSDHSDAEEKSDSGARAHEHSRKDKRSLSRGDHTHRHGHAHRSAPRGRRGRGRGRHDRERERSARRESDRERNNMPPRTRRRSNENNDRHPRHAHHRSRSRNKHEWRRLVPGAATNTGTSRRHTIPPSFPMHIAPDEATTSHPAQSLLDEENDEELSTLPASPRTRARSHSRGGSRGGRRGSMRAFSDDDEDEEHELGDILTPTNESTKDDTAKRAPAFSKAACRKSLP